MSNRTPTLEQAVEYLQAFIDRSQPWVGTTHLQKVVDHARGVSSSPEVILGRDATSLPSGSFVVACTAAGEPFVDAVPVKRIAGAWRGHDAPDGPGRETTRFLVLHRAPARPLACGDHVTAADVESERVPVGTLLEDAQGERGLVRDFPDEDDPGRGVVWLTADSPGRASRWPARIVTLTSPKES